MNDTPNSVWTPERVEQLKPLWAEGLSASQIASELGHGISRNAVIGKAMRLGLGKKTKGQNYAPKRSKPERVIRKNGAGYVPIVEISSIEVDGTVIDPADYDVADLEAQAPPASFLGITFMKLDEIHCRYIRTINNVNLYCGQPKTDGSSYCRECHRRCHVLERGFDLAVLHGDRLDFVKKDTAA